jgi:hypothetical protein
MQAKKLLDKYFSEGAEDEPIADMAAFQFDPQHQASSTLQNFSF